MFVYLSCITDLYVNSILEPRTNSYAALYVVVFLERMHYTYHTTHVSYYPYPCI
jgi:hypothetical protein